MNKDFFDDYFDDDEDYEPPCEKPKTFTKGFITALAVCVTAIGAAVYTTVNSVGSYLNPTVTVRQSSDSDAVYYEAASETAVNAQVSGVKASSSDEDKPVVLTCAPIKNKQITAEFSQTPVWCETLGDYRAHTGIDFEAEVGDKVRAMGSGVVKDIYADDLLGNVVVIEHSDEVESYYCGLAKTALVQPGEVVSPGDFVGTVYAIPGEAAQKAHVHVGVKENGVWTDPMKYLKIR